MRHIAPLAPSVNYGFADGEVRKGELESFQCHRYLDFESLAQLQPAEPAASAETEDRCGSLVVLYSASSLLVRALCDIVEDRPWSSDAKGISGF